MVNSVFGNLLGKFRFHSSPLLLSGRYGNEKNLLSRILTNFLRTQEKGRRSGQMKILNRAAASGIVIISIFALLSGCAAEGNLPFPIQEMGAGKPSKFEKMSVILDARGSVNGSDPADLFADPANFPVSYRGNWTIPRVTVHQAWYNALSDTPGSTVTLIATASRIVFDFWDFDFYPNPGVVSFEMDGKPVGEFSLARKNSGNEKILDYEIITGKKTSTTVKMTLKSGQVVLSGYLLVFE